MKRRLCIREIILWESKWNNKNGSKLFYEKKTFHEYYYEDSVEGDALKEDYRERGTKRCLYNKLGTAAAWL